MPPLFTPKNRNFNTPQPSHMRLLRPLVVVIAILLVVNTINAQTLYTAEGYFRETRKESYLKIKTKQEKGTALSKDEEQYVSDYEAYLQNYYNRLSEDEKAIYERMKYQWANVQNEQPAPQPPEDFEWRNRDRFLNAMFGVYYGATVVAISGSTGAANAGIPLVTGGLWLLGPAMNPKKYEGITQSTIRASNTGKTLGLGYGAALGLAIAGDADNTSNVVLAASSIGSIALGEAAFQIQKKRSIRDGQIEMMRHYGFLGPAVAGAGLFAAKVDNANLGGLGILAGGIAGLVVGKSVSQKYEYTRGDVDVVNSLAIVSTGVGLTAVVAQLENNEGSPGLILIPAATAVIGTVMGQRSVREVHLTRKQGSTVNLSTAGAALLGFGIMALTESDSPTAIVGVPTLLALGAHQALFRKYRQENLAKGLGRSLNRKSKKYSLAMRVQPENYVVNRSIGQPRTFNPQLSLSQPIVNFTLRFK